MKSGRPELSISRKINEGKPTIGAWIQIPNLSTCEIIGHLGYDWAALDLEHGLFNLGDLSSYCLALESGGTVPFARLPDMDKINIIGALEAGIKGLIFPQVESRLQVEDAIKFCLYPPLGARSVGYSRANLFGMNFGLVSDPSNKPFVIIQIESKAAVSCIDDILAVKGIDGLLIGPYDLSASLGITGDFGNNLFLDTISHIKKRAKVHNVPCGCHVVKVDPSELLGKVKEGYQWLAYGTDAMFMIESGKNPMTH